MNDPFLVPLGRVISKKIDNENFTIIPTQTHFRCSRFPWKWNCIILI